MAHVYANVAEKNITIYVRIYIYIYIYVCVYYTVSTDASMFLLIPPDPNFLRISAMGPMGCHGHRGDAAAWATGTQCGLHLWPAELVNVHQWRSPTAERGQGKAMKPVEIIVDL